MSVNRGVAESSSVFFFPVCMITHSLKSRTLKSSVWWWVGFLNRKVWPFSVLFTIFIIRAPQPDNPCRARDSGQTAVLMFLDLSAAVGRAGQHVPFPTHLQVLWLLVSQLASVLSQRDGVDTFPSIPLICKLFLNRTFSVATPHEHGCS